MHTSTRKYPNNSESGLNTTLNYGGPVKLVQINNLDDITMSLRYGPAKFDCSDWYLVNNPDARYMDELLTRTFRRIREPIRNDCVLFMCEI